MKIKKKQKKIIILVTKLYAFKNKQNFWKKQQMQLFNSKKIKLKKISLINVMIND